MAHRTIAVLAVVVGGCSDRDGVDRDATVEPSQTEGTLDPFVTGATWTLSEDDSSVELFQPVADLNGDALDDAVVRVCTDAGCSSFVVYGPLRRELVLPEDAAGTLPAGVGGVTHASDLTGDGITDLVMIGGDSYLVIEGPIVGTMTASTPLSGTLFDVNDDGVLDLATGGDPESITPRLELRYGPMSRFDGPADVVLDPSCDDEVDPRDESYFPPHLYPDFTGDGAPELVFSAYGYADTCNWWFLTPPPPGVYDPVVDLDAESPTNAFVVFPDQTGDGVADVAFSDDDDGWDLYAGPVTVVDDVASAGALITIGVPIGGLYKIPFDLNGDGIGEFLWRFGVSTVLVYGGATGIAERESARGSPGYARDAWLEDGIVSMAIVSGVRLAIVDLGPGVPVDNWPSAPLIE